MLTFRLSLALLAMASLTAIPSFADNTIPSPSPALLAALSAARTGSMADLVTWASGATANPSVSSLASTITALPAPDRDAFMYWLSAHGRGALHARGVSDEQIGVPYYAIDYSLVPAPWPQSITPLVAPAPSPTNTPTPAPHRASVFGGLLGAVLPSLQIPIASSSSSSSQTTTSNIPGGTETNSTYQSSGSSVSIGVNPWAVVGSLIDATSANAAPQPPSVPWRSLLFASSKLGDGGSGISVTHGFAAVRNDGTEGLACISFANQNEKLATEVDVDIEILDTLGFIRRVEPLRLTGSFAPGAEIGGPRSVQDLSSARANCVIDGEQQLRRHNRSVLRSGGGRVFGSPSTVRRRHIVAAAGCESLEPMQD